MGDQPNKKNRLPEQARKEQILQDITTVFGTKGFEGTSTRDLAEAADVSEGMIYKLFETKKELYEALIRKKIDDNPNTGFPDPAAGDRNDYEVFFQFGKSMIDRCREDPYFLRLLMFSALEGNELSDMFFEARIQKTVNQLADYIQSRIDENAFRDVDAGASALGFIGQVVNYMSVLHVYEFPLKEDKSPEEMLETFVTNTLEGIEK